MQASESIWKSATRCHGITSSSKSFLVRLRRMGCRGLVSETLPSGDSLVYGREGTVVDAACGEQTETHVDVHQLMWDNTVSSEPLGERTFDCVLCADCVYDRAWHAPLVATLKRVVNPVHGRVLLMASRRCGSLDDFKQLARTEFTVVDRGQAYDETVARRFRGSKCWPELLEMLP